MSKNSNGNKPWVPTSVHLLTVKNMPALKHSIPGEPFDISKSEVVQWLIKQPTVQQYLFELVNGHDKRKEKLIEYDSTTGTWKGIGY